MVSQIPTFSLYKAQSLKDIKESKQKSHKKTGYRTIIMFQYVLKVSAWGSWVA